MSSEWSNTQIYRTGEIVTLNGSSWTCSRDYNYNNAPSLQSTWWIENVTPTPPTPSGWEFVGGITFAPPAIPSPGGETNNTQTLIDSTLLEPGSTYYVTGAVVFAAYDSSPLTVPRSITWEAGLDRLQVSIATPSSNPAATVDVYTQASIFNARGFVGEAYDYPFELLISTDGAPISGNLAIDVLVQNKSGTVGYGNASSVDAIVYKVA